MFFLHFLKISSLLLSGAFQTEALYFQKLWLFLIFPLINILRWSWQERDLLSWIPEWTTLESSASQAKTSTKSWSKQNTGGRKQEMRGGLLGKLWGALSRHQRAFISWARKGWCRWAFRSATSAGPRKPEQVLLHPNTTQITQQLAERRRTLGIGPGQCRVANLPHWAIEKGSSCFLASGRPNRVP